MGKTMNSFWKLEQALIFLGMINFDIEIFNIYLQNFTS